MITNESKPKTILLTGATGFVGGAILDRLIDRPNLNLRVAGRHQIDLPSVQVEQFQIPDLNAEAFWPSIVEGVDCVIHSAARAHVMKETRSDALAAYRQINVGGTLKLAREAATAKVRRFIFLSSIKVNGEATQPGQPFTHADKPAPEDDYGISKMEAEAGLMKIAHRTGMEVVIIRPVLVYGPGVKGNFSLLMKLLQTPIPLPLASIKNKRSFVALDNLTDLIKVCINHPEAANQTFLVSDGQDLSTPELLDQLAAASGRPPRLWPFPVAFLKLAGSLLGKSKTERLLGSLQVDITHTQEKLDWVPPLSVDQGLSKLKQE